MRKRSILILGLLFGLPVLNTGLAASEPLSVSSPDGRLKISLALKANPQPYLPGQRAYYRVTYGSTLILDDSPLGLDFLGANVLEQDF